MYTIVNMCDVTRYIPPDDEENGSSQSSAISYSASLSDPASTWDFMLDDINQTINVQNFQPVIVFDENASAIGGIATVPSMNFSVGQSYVAGGTLSAIISSHFSFNNPTFTYTFSNNAVGVGYMSQNTLLGYVQPGVSYMFSAYFICTVALTNANGYLQVNWLDVNGNTLSSISQTYASTLVQVHENISGVAPAGAVYAQIILGGQTTNTTNSGTMKWSSPQFEPMWFAWDGVSYPTPDCNATQVNTVVMPDGTYSRKCRIFAGYVEDHINAYVSRQRHTQVNCAATSKVLETSGPISLSVTATQDTTVLTDAIAQLTINTTIINQLSTGQQNQFSPSSTLIAGVTIDSLTWNASTMRTVTNDVCGESGSLFYVDPYCYLWYVPPSFSAMIFELSDSPDYVVTFPYYDFLVEYDSTNPVNTALVQGSKQAAAAITDPFSGDGSTTIFNLTEPPDKTTAVTVGGSAIRTGVDGVDNAKFGASSTYKALINKQNQTIKFATAPAAGTNNILVTYTYEDQVISQVIAADAVANQKAQFWGIVSDSNITSTTSAKNRGLAELQDYAQPRTILTLSALNIYMPVGSLILFTCQSENMSAQPFTIQTVQINPKGGGVYGWDYTAGVYNPTEIDHLRNIKKAVAKTPTTANVVVVASIDVALFDSVHLNDSMVINHNGPAPTGPFVYGANYIKAVQYTTPQRWYRMNEASGTTANDSGSQAQNGTIHGGVTLGQTGLIASSTDTAMLFNGSTGYISLPTTSLPSGASAWTVELWFKAPSPTSFQPILSLGSTTVAANGMQLSCHSTSGAFTVGNATTALVTGAVISASTIYYAAVTYDGTTITLYLYSGGSLVGTYTATYTYNLAYGTAYIGQDFFSDFFSGTMQGVSLYTSVLSSSTIAQHAAEGFSNAVGAVYGFAAYS